MHTPDDQAINQAAADDQAADREKALSEELEQSEPVSAARSRWNWRPDLSGLAARLRRAESISETPTEPIPAVRTTPAFLTLPPTLLHPRSWRWRRATRKDRLRDWQSWSKFRLWRRTRPLWGSLLMICAGLIMVISAAFFLSLAFLAQSLWPALLVGGLLLIMGVIQLFLPSYSVITGSIGIVLSLVSLLVASFGGCGLGLLLGVVGSALSIAWRPIKRSRLIASSTS